ncbi:Zinc finger protein 76 [Paragonimus kellicotti]|nr:Zinc finger protein 76 [Paragonimus kellicotti]
MAVASLKLEDVELRSSGLTPLTTLPSLRNQHDDRRHTRSTNPGGIKVESGSVPQSKFRRRQKPKRPETCKKAARGTKASEYACPYTNCNRVLTSAHSLKQHICGHTGEKPFKCDYPNCNVSCRNADNFRNHRLLHLDRSERPRFFCTQPGCFRVFLQRSSLRDHLNVHKDRRPYVCDHPECGRRFRQHIHMKEHKLSHLHRSERPCFFCPDPGCDKVYLSERSLRMHSYTHSGHYPFICEYPGCNLGVVTAAALRRHMLKHMNLQGSSTTIRCTYPHCCQSFTGQGELAKHKRKYHPEELKFHCDVPGCTERFATLSGLVRHCGKHTEKRKPTKTSASYALDSISSMKYANSEVEPILFKCISNPKEFVLGPIKTEGD